MSHVLYTQLTCSHSPTFCVLHPVYPVENFTISSSSETTLSFSWTQSRIVADSLTGYILTCSSLLEGTPSPDPLVIGPTATTANVTELLSGVTYSCEIITLTFEGRSQPRTLNSTTVETGQYNYGSYSYECFLFSTCSMTLCL